MRAVLVRVPEAAEVRPSVSTPSPRPVTPQRVSANFPETASALASARRERDTVDAGAILPEEAVSSLSSVALPSVLFSYNTRI